MCISRAKARRSRLQWDANRTNLGADIASDKVQADWLMARSRGRNTFLLWTSAGSTLDGNFKSTDLPQLYSLGGFLNLSGLPPESLIGPHYAIARAIYFRKIGRGGEGFFEFPAYLGMSFEVGNTWEHRGDLSLSRRRARTHRYSSRSIRFSGPSTWGPATIRAAQRRSIFFWAGLFRR